MSTFPFLKISILVYFWKAHKAYPKQICLVSWRETSAKEAQAAYFKCFQVKPDSQWM